MTPEHGEEPLIQSHEARLRVIRGWTGTHVHWTWTQCNGEPIEMSPIIDRKGHWIDLGSPPTVCTIGPDFTCPVHPRPEPIVL